VKIATSLSRKREHAKEKIQRFFKAPRQAARERVSLCDSGIFGAQVRPPPHRGRRAGLDGVAGLG